MHRLKVTFANPMLLATGATFLALLTMLILEPVVGNGMAAWRAGQVALLLYIVINQVSGLFVAHWVRYVLVSIGCFAVSLLVLVLAARGLSTGVTANMSAVKQLYALLTLFYILLVGLAGLFRVALWIIKNADGDDDD